jgi:hypothetical protein
MNKLKEKQIIDLRRFKHEDKLFKRIYESNGKDNQEEDVDSQVFEIRTDGDIIKMIHYLLDVLSAELIFDKIETFKDIYDKSKD